MGSAPSTTAKVATVGQPPCSETKEEKEVPLFANASAPPAEEKEVVKKSAEPIKMEAPVVSESKRDDDGYDSEKDEPPKKLSTEESAVLTGKLMKTVVSSPSSPHEKQETAELGLKNEMLAVLFELLPFYNQNNGAVDALVRKSIEAMTEDDCSAVDANGSSALIVCAQYGLHDLAEILLRRGGNINAVNSAGVTALSYACGARPLSERLIRLLLDHNADPNISELHYGCTALHYLAATGDENLCALLIRNGADATAKDWYEWTAADYATDAGHYDCAEKLRSAAAVKTIGAEWRRNTLQQSHESTEASASSEELGTLRAEFEAAKAALEAQLEAQRAQTKALESAKASKQERLEEQANDLKKMQSMLKSALAEAETYRCKLKEAHETCAQVEAELASKNLPDATSEQHQRELLEAKLVAEKAARQAEAEKDQATLNARQQAEEFTARLDSTRAKGEEAANEARRLLNESQQREQAIAAKLQASLADAVEARAARDAAISRARLADEQNENAARLERRNEQLDKDLSREIQRRKHLHNQIEDMKGRIRVYVRLRPKSSKEQGFEACVREGQSGVSVIRPDKKPPQDRQHFELDRAFDANDGSQQAVFADVKSLVLSCVDGFNVCIFAYGQSGSGKTHTMLGPKSFQDSINLQSWQVDDSAGIVPRSVVEVFRVLEERSAQCSFEVEVTMYELYRDSLRDLLAPKTGRSKSLDIKLAQFSASGLVEVEGATVRSVANISELVNALNEGIKARSTAHTELNAESSRSHLTISLVLKTVNRRTQATVRGKLTLVDLAGSERVEKSGVTGDQLKEATSINKSLSAIGDVISSLAGNGKHIPYRNHPLTMLLSDVIGGDAKTLMFVNCSPASEHVSETQNSLTFAARCKSVKQRGGGHQVQAQLKELKAELERMKASGAQGKAQPNVKLMRPVTPAVGSRQNGVYPSSPLP